MREIKFRAWSKVANMFLDITGFETEKGRVYGLFHDGDYIGYDKEDIHLMQYTGLKDKSGNEIYEGDILECTSELLTNFGKTRTGRFETTYKQVIWLTDSWGYRVRKSKHIIEGAERKGLEVAIKFGVVCGNIHENPELLKTK